MNEEEKLYTIKEVSEVVGISESEIIRMVMIRKLPAIRVGKAIRIKEDDLEIFLNVFLGEEEVKTGYREPVLYTAEQIAKILKLSVDNIWNLLKTGRLKGFKVREGRSSWRIPAESLKEFIESRTQKTV
ncbi:MAG: helix-turn-helix domain-containing protein [Actinomycetia bacterium]|nr:helix-turn-helix domain-containing protein [Actinomycetota bacterium]MCG2790474.1 helix-turn-helix domain-containing protein [Actinomycetes bacterium]